LDPSALLPIITPVVTATIAYIRDEAAKKAGAKAVEAIGEKAGEAVAGIGPKALTTLRAWFQKKSDSKATQALANVIQDPSDQDYQQKLIKETVRIASTDPAFTQELKILAEQVTIAQPNSMVQTINNQAPNQGAQGIFTASVTFNRPTHDE